MNLSKKMGQRVSRRSLVSLLSLAIAVAFAAPGSAAVFDTFDVEAQTVTSAGGATVTGTLDIPTILALGAPSSTAFREIVATPGTATVDTASGGKFIHSGTVTQYRYGTFAASPTQMNLDLSGFDGFEFDVLSVTGTANVAIQFLTDGNANHHYGSNIAVSAPGTYSMLWADFTLGAALMPTLLEDVDGVIVIHNYGGGSGQLEVSEFRVIGSAVPEPSGLALAALGLVGLGWFGIRRWRKV